VGVLSAVIARRAGQQREAVALASILGVDLRELATDTDAKRENAHRQRVMAQAAVRGLQLELHERFRQVEEAQLLLASTDARLEAARKRLAELEEEK